MSRLTILSVLLALAAFCSAAAIDEPSVVTKVFREYLPSEVVEAYKSLTKEDKAVLKDVFKNYKSYKDEKEVIAALKEKSPALGAKAEQLYEKLEQKINGLSDEGKKFAKGLLQAARELHAQSVNGEKVNGAQIKSLLEGQAKAFKALPASVQAELKEKFPGLTNFLQDETVQTLLAKLIELKTHQ